MSNASLKVKTAAAIAYLPYRKTGNGTMKLVIVSYTGPKINFAKVCYIISE